MSKGSISRFTSNMLEVTGMPRANHLDALPDIRCDRGKILWLADAAERCSLTYPRALGTARHFS